MSETNLGLGLGIGAVTTSSGGSGGGGFATQVVGSRGEMSLFESSATVSGDEKRIYRYRFYIGNSDCTELQIMHAGWLVGQNTGEANASNDCRVSDTLEINGTVVRVQYSSSNDGDLNPGSNLISDVVTPSQFGLSVFPAGMEIWGKTEMEVAIGEVLLQSRQNAFANVASGEGCVRAGTGATTQLDTAGPLTTGGGWATADEAYLPLAILGKPTSSMMAVATMGASIVYGVDDGSGDGVQPSGGGFMRRAINHVDGAIKIASVSLARPSEEANTLAGSMTNRLTVMQYINHVILSQGGNDYTQGKTVNGTITNVRSIRSQIKTANSSAHITELYLFPKTDSTDGWTTQGNQTPRTDFETGGTWRDAFNDTLVSDVGVNDLDAAFNFTAGVVTDTTNLDRWRTDIQSTTDGTHPSSSAHDDMAVDFGEHLSARRTAYEGAYQFSTEGSAVLSAMTSVPTDRDILIDQHVRRLISYELWDEMDAIYRFAAHNSGAGLVNWKSPGTGDATLVNSPTFSADNGFTTNGTNNYIDTINPATFGGVFSQNDAAISFRTLTASATDSSRIGWFDGADGITVTHHRADTNGFTFRMNQSSTTSHATLPNNTPTAFVTFQRTGATSPQIFFDGVEQAATGGATQASTAVNNHNIRFGSITDSAFVADEYACGYIGSSLTAEQAEILSALDNEYMRAIGAL